MQAKIDKTRAKKLKARWEYAALEEEFNRVKKSFKDKCEELRVQIIKTQDAEYKIDQVNFQKDCVQSEVDKLLYQVSEARNREDALKIEKKNAEHTIKNLNDKIKLMLVRKHELEERLAKVEARYERVEREKQELEEMAEKAIEHHQECPTTFGSHPVNHPSHRRQTGTKLSQHADSYRTDHSVPSPAPGGKSLNRRKTFKRQ